MNQTREITQEIRELALFALDNKIAALKDQRAKLVKMLPFSRQQFESNITQALAVADGIKAKPGKMAPAKQQPKRKISAAHRANLKAAAKARWAKARAEK